MLPHTRALIAASAYAFVKEKKVAGLYDHSAGRHLRIAAESRGEHLQGYDGDRQAKFGGALPEIYDAGDEAYVSFQIAGNGARGHDRRTASSFTANVTDSLVQVYDHGQSVWFAFDVRTA